MWQGLIISLVFSGIIYACMFLGYPFINEFSKEYLFVFFLPIILIGCILGLAGKRIYENRFQKLFLIGIFLVYLSSLFYAAAMVLSDESAIMKGREVVTGILMLGSTGFLIFGIFTVPLLALGVFLVELWTHPKM
jgi:hypothetical protein